MEFASPPSHARLTAISRSVAIAIVALGACGGSARGPPLPLHIALERAHQALCAADGVESPRALVAALAPDASCSAVGVAARVRCYLGLPDTTVVVKRLGDGYRIRFVMPSLSDHVHEVTVRRPRHRLVVEVDSAN